jgi:hypothetical protein
LQIALGIAGQLIMAALEIWSCLRKLQAVPALRGPGTGGTAVSISDLEVVLDKI